MYESWIQYNHFSSIIIPETGPVSQYILKHFDLTALFVLNRNMIGLNTLPVSSQLLSLTGHFFIDLWSDSWLHLES